MWFIHQHITFLYTHLKLLHKVVYNEYKSYLISNGNEKPTGLVSSQYK